MSSKEGHESPPPERQTGAQQKEAPGSGTGVQSGGDTKDRERALKNQLDALASNPKGPMDDELAKKFAKTEQ